MKAAYRVPTGLFPSIDRFISQETLVNTPITDIMVNSIITMPTDGSRLHAGQPVNVTGIAWDGGRGVDRVMVSIDDGKTWSEALLGEDLGRYSFRQWSLAIRNPKKGRLAILARASNKAGQTQVLSAIFNPAGYHHNVAQRISVEIV